MNRITPILPLFGILPALAACSPCMLLETTLNSDETLRDGRVAKHALPAFSKEARYGSGYREVFQFSKRVWIHTADGWRERCVRAHLRGRARRHEHPQRRPEGQF